MEWRDVSERDFQDGSDLVRVHIAIIGASESREVEGEEEAEEDVGDMYNNNSRSIINDVDIIVVCMFWLFV